jgi:hypothetical protein
MNLSNKWILLVVISVSIALLLVYTYRDRGISLATVLAVDGSGVGGITITSRFPDTPREK